jgi:hypothetical protein
MDILSRFEANFLCPFFSCQNALKWVVSSFLNSIIALKWGQNPQILRIYIVMPYKDPKRRREYNREYMRRRLAGLSNPGAPVTKVYLCLDFPDVVLCGMGFKNGFYITSDPERQALIERHEYYGKHIHSWPADP